VQYFDAIFIVNLLRWPFALMGFINSKTFKTYSMVRLITWWMQTIVIFGALIALIIMEVLYWEALNYVYLTGASLIACVIVGIDYHFTTVVRFCAKHPTSQKAPIKWLSSDSEP